MVVGVHSFSASPDPVVDFVGGAWEDMGGMGVAIRRANQELAPGGRDCNMYVTQGVDATDGSRLSIIIARWVLLGAGRCFAEGCLDADEIGRSGTDAEEMLVIW